MRSSFVVFALLVCSTSGAALAQTEGISGHRERAQLDYRLGWQLMRDEAFDDALSAFRRAAIIDPSFEDAHYGVGRAHMMLRQYGQAIAAYTRCRDLYEAQAGRHFASREEAQRYRRDRLAEIDAVIRDYEQSAQTARTQGRLRQLQDQRREIAQTVDRGSDIGAGHRVPAFVSLALGSAYFRSGRIADAEREYKAAIAAQPATGEAHNNLAVVYFETGRLDDAVRSVKAAEKAGYRVHPALKQDIEDRRRGSQ